MTSVWVCVWCSVNLKKTFLPTKMTLPVVLIQLLKLLYTSEELCKLKLKLICVSFTIYFFFRSPEEISSYISRFSFTVPRLILEACTNRIRVDYVFRFLSKKLFRFFFSVPFCCLFCLYFVYIPAFGIMRHFAHYINPNTSSGSMSGTQLFKWSKAERITRVFWYRGLWSAAIKLKCLIYASFSQCPHLGLYLLSVCFEFHFSFECIIGTLWNR